MNSLNSPIEYIDKPFGNFNWWGLSPGTLLEDLHNEIAWEQRDAPRKECFMSTKSSPYTYGKGAGERTYHPNAFTSIVNCISGMTDHYDCGGFDLCFANYYGGPRDHLGWHADDSPYIDHTAPIAVVSVGAEREIWFRENGSDVIEKLVLTDGSLLIMKPGMQMTHQHRIPKHGAECGARLSLTFRKSLSE